MKIRIRQSLLLLALTVAFAPFARAADPQQAAAEVDRRLQNELLADQHPAPPADDQTFLKRVFLDIVGKPPTPNDIVAFSLDSRPNKRQAVVDRLLQQNEYGENWSKYWRDVILFRRSEDRALLGARALQSFLEEKLNEGAGWDEVATRFITASGDIREDGSTGLIMAQFGQPEETVAEISRIFMGIQIQCAQCHDHPTDKWTREQFHQLAAFFPRVAVRPNRMSDQRTFLVTVTDRKPFRRRTNANNRYVGTLEHRMPNLENPAEEGKLMEPVFFVTGDKLDSGARDAERREALAKWITGDDNPWFARAYVNRMWAELVGEGFYDPVDDIGPERECSAPDTLDYLATQFVASGHDPRWLIRTITATEAYRRESRDRRTLEQAPFLANCSQRLRGDQLFDTLLSALDIRETQFNRRGGGGGYGQAGPRNLFNSVFSYDPSERREEVESSIPQALALMNSPLIENAIDGNRRGGLGKLLRENTDNKVVLNELYLRTLARQPSDNELTVCLTHIRQVKDRKEAFEDILWSLVNSTEFLHRR